MTNTAQWDGSGGRVLFVPVSGARGMGEYARALALATGAAQRWPALDIHFVVSQQAPYAADTPFPRTLIPASPTFHSAEVIEVIRSFRPSLVVFDNAGRTAQLQAAAAAGARVIYVSSRVNQRRKAFRPQWMRAMDEHWIAYPEFIAGSPGFIEKTLLRLMGRPRLKFLDALLPAGDPERASEVLSRFAVREGEYVLVVPGGGSDHEGRNGPQIIAHAARSLAQRGYPAIVAGVTSLDSVRQEPATGEGSKVADSVDIPSELRLSPRLPMATLGELIRRARLVVSNGGDTLLQALACHRACVAVPIAGDQPHRIARCVEASLALSAQLDTADIERVALSVLESDELRRSLERNTANGAVTDGMEGALTTIARLARPA